MKSLIIIFNLLVVYAYSQNDSLNNKHMPYILFEKTTYDFGTLEYGSNATYEFVFKNVGKKPLIITNCKSSCDCTVPDCPKDPVTKGKIGKIKVSYNTTNVGSFSKTITIHSNAQNNPVILTIRGKVKPKQETKPNP